MINISETLVANISKNYLFYIPSSIYNDIEAKGISAMIPNEAYDTILYFKKDVGAVSEDLEKNAPLGVFQKKNILQSNLLLLLENKPDVNADVFKLIIEDYKKHIECHLFITNWLAANVITAFPDVSKSILVAFKNQSQFFKEHYLQLEQHFQISPETPQFKNTDLFKAFKSVIPETNLKTESHEDTEAPKPKTSKRKKREKLKINDEETELFLLKTVFNVDIPEE